MVFMPHWPLPKERTSMRLGLDRIYQLMERLGNPQNSLPPVVHFAGTNGKGSTLAFLKSILEAAGYKVHSYTSPHLVEFNERIMLAGKQISDEYLYDCLERCKVAAKDIEISFFEGTTAAAFLAFAETSADVILLETGLGGRLDATNIIEKPALTVLTPISFDHMQQLGNSLSLIAAEKAAIIKDTVPCIVSHQELQAAEVIKKVAAGKKAPLYMMNEHWHIEAHEDGFEYSSGDFKIFLPRPALSGAHQLINAATAIAAARKLNIDDEAIIFGMSAAVWPGRLQPFEKFSGILPKGSKVWLDGGHNPAAAITIRDFLLEQKKPLYIIIGMLRDKDMAQFLSAFKDVKAKILAVPVAGEDCHKPAFIVEKSKELGMDAAEFLHMDAAIKSIKEESSVIICGSLYLVGSVLAENYQSDRIKKSI